MCQNPHHRTHWYAAKQQLDENQNSTEIRHGGSSRLGNDYRTLLKRQKTERDECVDPEIRARNKEEGRRDHEGKEGIKNENERNE